MADLSKHPCFNAEARLRFGRIHLPVAPACNVQCNFCDRKYCCVNESRPGVTASVMTPREALRHLDQIVSERGDIAVVGIAGPGDPFANTEATLATLRLVHAKYPEMLLCVATNGLNLPENIDALCELEVSHVTVTMNGIDPRIVAQIYAWVHYDNRNLTGLEAAEILIARQTAGIQALVAHGIIAKVNTIIIPGINDTHVAEVSEKVASWGADVQNCIPLLPVAGTAFGTKEQPSPALIHAIRAQAGEHLLQMAHCSRCRADACGLLGEGFNAGKPGAPCPTGGKR
jgi:nitrogen fixation protein NifB